MCQIFCATGTTFSFNFQAVNDLYDNNPDGLGFVDFANPDHALKVLPASAQEAWDFIQTHVNGRQGVVHFRWRTDGALDTDRVHPYKTGERFWLIHNGILSNYRSTFGAAKKTPGIHYGPWPAGTQTVHDKVVVEDPRSDTQRIAEETLGPLLDKFGPDLAFSAEFQKMLSNYIGSSNRFVLVDRVTGAHCIINEHTGHHPEDGIWQANQYAGDYRWVKPKFKWANGGWNQHKGSKGSKGNPANAGFVAAGYDSGYGDYDYDMYDGMTVLGKPNEVAVEPDDSDVLPMKLAMIDDVLEWYSVLGYFEDTQVTAQGKVATYLSDQWPNLSPTGRQNQLRAMLNLYKMHDAGSFVMSLEEVEQDVELYCDNMEDPGASGLDGWARESLLFSLDGLLTRSTEHWIDHWNQTQLAKQVGQSVQADDAKEASKSTAVAVVQQPSKAVAKAAAKGRKAKTARKQAALVSK